MTTEIPSIQTIDLDGRRYVILPESEYCRLTGEPPLPDANERGHYPALEAMRVLLARDIIRDRRRLGLSQAELARRAGVAPETLNRIERGRVSPSMASIEKIDRALEQAGQKSRKQAKRTPRNGRRKKSG